MDGIMGEESGRIHSNTLTRENKMEIFRHLEKQTKQDYDATHFVAQFLQHIS